MKTDSPFALENPYDIDAERVVTKLDKDYKDLCLNQYSKNAGHEEQAHSQLSPSVIVYCRHEKQVISAILFAKQYHYSVTCRSGGHSYTGESSSSAPKSLQIDLSYMNQVSIKDDIAEVESGVILTKLKHHLRAHKLSYPLGVCKGVGIGGHLQSSAHGPLIPSHGSGLDHILSFRIVLSSGEVMTLSKNDKDPTFYKAVLGSAPGSWGIITQYTLKCIPDKEFPHSKLIIKKYPYSKELFIKIINIIDFIVKDQEKNNLRDLWVSKITGPSMSLFDLLSGVSYIGKWSNLINLKINKKMYITVAILWTGIDSGKLDANTKRKYISLFDELRPLSFPSSIEASLPLSFISSLATIFKYDGYRYHIGSISSNRWWSKEFIELYADEFDERAKTPDLFNISQYVPNSSSWQFYKNTGMNSLAWRDMRPYLDDWVFFKNTAEADNIGKRMGDFFNRTQAHWSCEDGSVRYNWMSPQTIYNDATDLKNEDTAKKFFPNQEEYTHLRSLKTILDPINMFNNRSTIPPLPVDTVNSSPEINSKSMTLDKKQV